MTQTRLVVLDDDPTGIQTVQGCLLITRWDDATVERAFADEQPFFYILTNTRAMTREEAAATVRSAMEAVLRVNSRLGYRLILVSRSDSCLRGHFPLETDVMRQVMTEHGQTVAPRTPFCPAFIEAGRVTIKGVHYMKEGARYIPVSETEFARDNVFAYHTSVLTEYIREKGANPDDYDIIDASSYDELRAFVATLPKEGHVIIRSSSSLPKAIADFAPLSPPEGGTNDETFKGRSIEAPSGAEGGTSGASVASGCFVVGSHVQKTTRQLERLLNVPGTCGVEIDVNGLALGLPLHPLTDGNGLAQPGRDDLLRDTLTTIKAIADEGLTPVIYTSRQELRLADADARQHLGQQVSDFLVDIVRQLPFAPAYLVAKGGITSHDILTRGLGVTSARVLGQVVPNVPCVMAGDMPYVIFPGNVGNDDSLRELYEKLSANK